MSRSRRSMQPGKLGAIENTVAKIDWKELRGQGGLLVQHLSLLANVAVDHAQDGRDAKPPAKRKRCRRADIAEDQESLGPVPCQQAGQPSIEPCCSCLREQPFAGLRSPREPCFDLQRQVDAGDRGNTVGGNLGIVPSAAGRSPAGRIGSEPGVGPVPPAVHQDRNMTMSRTLWSSPALSSPITA